MNTDNYFISDIWNLKEYPNPIVRNHFRIRVKDAILDFTQVKSKKVKEQLKGYYRYYAENEIPLLKDQSSNSISQVLTRWVSALHFLAETPIPYHDLFLDHEQLSEAYVQYAQEQLGRHPATHRSGKPYFPGNVFTSIRKYLIEKDNTNLDIWERTIWDQNDMLLAPERMNPTSGIHTLRIDYTINKNELQCVQHYIRHLVLHTTLSFTGIYNTNTELRIFCTILHSRGHKLTEATREDLLYFYEKYGKTVKRSTLNNRISVLYRFFEYMVTYNMITTNPLSLHDIAKTKYQYKLKSVDDKTIAQIFSVLDKVPDTLTCMFLILFCTGMRVSEVCQLRSDCLLRNENGDFIVFYCQKMRKAAMNQIPEALTDRLEKEIAHNKSLPYNEEYLFPRSPHKPFLTSTFQNQFTLALAKHDIRFSDGTPFIFRPHDWRHTLATKMYQSNIDISIIQSVLHHKSIEMTMAYVELPSEQMQIKQQKFLNYRGDIVDEQEEITRLNAMRENIHAQLLPNGFCSLPASMNKCPHMNACMDACPYFRTNKNYLSIHQQYLNDIEQYMQLCRDKKWTTQYEAAVRIHENIVELIRRISDEQ